MHVCACLPFRASSACTYVHCEHGRTTYACNAHAARTRTHADFHARPGAGARRLPAGARVGARGPGAQACARVLRMHACMCASAHTRARTHTCAYVHMRACACAHTRACTCAHVRALSHTHTRTHARTHTHMRTHAHTHTRTHTHARTHARALTHMYACTHTPLRSRVQLLNDLGLLHKIARRALKFLQEVRA